MTATRFNQTLRANAAKRILEYAFKGRESAMLTREKELFQALITHHVGKDTLAQISALPETWFPKATKVVVNTKDGWSGFVEGDGLSFCVPYEGCSYTGYVRLTVRDDELNERVRLFLLDREALKNDKSKLASDLSALLSTMYTFERLYEVEPDFEPILAPMLKVVPGAKTTALVPLAGTIMCEIAKARGETREGCCTEAAA
jgi:hypothetical protein